jgi:hypothetical protein
VKHDLVRVVVVVLLIGLVGMSSYEAFQVSSLTSAVNSLQQSVTTLQSEVGSLSSAAKGEIRIFENLSLDPTYYGLGPMYVTITSASVEGSSGDWWTISSSNQTIALGPSALLGVGVVPAGNYTAVRLTIGSARLTLTNMTDDTMKNETVPTSPGLTIKAPIPHGAAVFASVVTLVLSFNDHVIGGTALNPSLTLGVASVSQQS